MGYECMAVVVQGFLLKFYFLLIFNQFQLMFYLIWKTGVATDGVCFYSTVIDCLSMWFFLIVDIIWKFTYFVLSCVEVKLSFNEQPTSSSEASSIRRTFLSKTNKETLMFWGYKTRTRRKRKGCTRCKSISRNSSYSLILLKNE